MSPFFVPAAFLILWLSFMGTVYYGFPENVLKVTVEGELIENITNIVQQIVTQERILRNRLKEKQKISVLDGIYRSYGILKYARKVS